MTDRIDRFLAENHLDSPFLVIDLERVAENYRRLREALPLTSIHYAVKANPAPEIVRLLVDLGACFDAASPAEIDICLEAGALPARISFGSTVKKQSAIAHAWERGVRQFAFDSEAELEKISAAAPGARVFCRIVTSSEGADWPLSRKFGCDPGMARMLLQRARDLKLQPCGVSFHVGSQQRYPHRWSGAIAEAAALFAALEEDGIRLDMVNLGGGLPTHYRSEVPELDAYVETIMGAVTRHFGEVLPTLVIEPGRALVGDAGIIQSEVVLIAEKGYGEVRRWVYLDIGRFGGLAEAADDAIHFPIRTPRDGGPAGPVAIAGPTCDSVDVMYETTDYELPLDLKVGDRIEILSAGAYTASYSSVGFNGFPPLRQYCI